MKHLLTLAFIISTSFTVFAQTNNLVEWKTVEQADSLQANGDKRLIFMDIYADWCYPCKLMDKNTFKNEEVATYLNQNFIPVKLNAETEQTITFKGKTYEWIRNGRSGIQTLAYALLEGNVRYPSMPIVSTEGKTLTVISGFIAPDQFLEIIKDLKGQIEDYYTKNSSL